MRPPPVNITIALTQCTSVINESEAINEFFQDAFTSPVMRRLLPADPFRRAHARSVVRMNDLYLQMQLYDLIRAKVGALQGSPLLNGVNRVLDAIEAGFVGPFTAGNDQSLAGASPYNSIDPLNRVFL